MSKINFHRFILLLPLFAVLTLTYSNCSQTNFSSVTAGAVQSILSTSPSGSNGGIYGGLQYRVYQHVVPNFTCEGRPQPESILITQDLTNWLLIQNTPTKCAQQNEVAVAPVTYDPILNRAHYHNYNYVPPMPYVADAAENPNLPDVKLEDGVCEDANGKCSLLAAVQQSSYVTMTAESSVQVPSGTYLMSTPMAFSTYGNSLSISGPADLSAVIDGQNSTNLFNVASSIGQLSIQNLAMQNAQAPTLGAGAIMATNIDQMLVQNCTFTATSESSGFSIQVLRASLAGQLTMQNLTLTNLEGDTIDIEQLNTVNISNMQIVGAHNSGTTLIQEIQTLDLNLFSLDAAMGLQIWNSINVLIQNSTVSNNSMGVRFGYSPGVTPVSLVVENTVITDNNYFGAAYGYGIEFINGNLLTQFVFNNVTIANHGSSPDCYLDVGSNPSIASSGSTYDDSSCNAFLVSGP